MFAKLGALALCASLASAATITVSAIVAVGGILAVDVALGVGEPSLVCFELVMGTSVVDTVTGVGIDEDKPFSYEVPKIAKPGEGYVLRAVNPNDHDDVYGTSGPFTITK